MERVTTTSKETIERISVHSPVAVIVSLSTALSLHMQEFVRQVVACLLLPSVAVFSISNSGTWSDGQWLEWILKDFP